MDHLKSALVDIIPIYVDAKKRFHRLLPAQLYSNTPADFDFKLSRMEAQLDLTSLEKLFQAVDLVFPLIHGAFGEDGEIQALLESTKIPFVGHSSSCCRWMFPKHQAAETLRRHGFATLPQAILSHEQKNLREVIEDFFYQHALQRAIVKPVIGGSSIGVSSVKTPQEACQKVQEIFTTGLDCRALLEPFCRGREFTVIVFERLAAEPVALIPTEVELSYENNEIFDYRKKYLPTHQATYHTPPRFSSCVVAQIRMQAEQLFTLFGMRDFVRLDGWVLEGEKIYFTDINPVSGLEQNSFFFRQTSLLGMTHRQALASVLNNACQRYGFSFPIEETKELDHPKQPVYVLFGGDNAERQVSLMSGTNVWLKLLHSQRYAPTPFFFDPQGVIWELPYSFGFYHTVEEMSVACLNAQQEGKNWVSLIETIQRKLGIKSSSHSPPHQMLLHDLIALARRNNAFIFIAMHGGEGENGSLQRDLERENIPFNGSNAEVSALCMDKYLTGQAIRRLADPDLLTLPKKNICFADLIHCSLPEFQDLWEEYCAQLGSQRLIVKPRRDGCSAGIVLLQSAQDFARYCHLLSQKITCIPALTFTYQSGLIDMPSSFTGDFLLEPYIETDRIVVQQAQLNDAPKEGWIELTVGVLEQGGVYHPFHPTLTLATGPTLSLEEKFQGGTGVNLTPPPEEILSSSAVGIIKSLVVRAAQALGIRNYGRLDIFFNRWTEKMILIEANTLPALTPSTVFYHQALAEEPPLTPLALLSQIIEVSIARLSFCPHMDN